MIDATRLDLRRSTFVPYDEVYGQGIEDMLHRIPSTEKIPAAIGWQPTLALDEILADVISGVRERLERAAVRP